MERERNVSDYGFNTRAIFNGNILLPSGGIKGGDMMKKEKELNVAIGTYIDWAR